MNSEYQGPLVILRREAGRRIREGAEFTERFPEFLSLAAARAFKARPEGGPELTEVNRLVQLLVLPSLSVSGEISYEIFKLTSDDNTSAFMGARLNWEHEADFANLKTALEESEDARQSEPTIGSQMGSLPLQQTTNLVAELTRLHLPVGPPRTGCFGLDGTSYEMTLGDTWNWIKYHWWGNPPLEWSGLGEIAESIVTLIEHTSESL